MAKILIVSFEPFAGRRTNGSIPVGKAVTEILNNDEGGVAEHLVIPTAWSSLHGLLERFDRYELVLGLGEGFPWYVTVERFAFKRAMGKDVNEMDPPDVSGWGDTAVLESSLAWDESRMCDELGTQLALESPVPIIRGTFDGYFLCNSLHWHILQSKRSGGFIHLPPQDEWVDRTGQDNNDYKEFFAAAVILVMRYNKLI